MRLSDFDYQLPKELIAQYPLKERDKARLLVLERTSGNIRHCIFKEITDYLKKGDLLIINDTKVIHSRLRGQRVTGGKVEVLLLRRKKGLIFEALIRPARIKPQEKIVFDGGKIWATVIADGQILFDSPDVSTIYNLSSLPLPPYIKREPEELDEIYYQTVYAKREGAIAAPTAGLHFSESLIEKIKSEGINIASVTLHISYSTFKPVKVEDVTQHKMTAEYFEIPQETIVALSETQQAKARIFSVGTTSMRALETYAQQGRIQGYTDLYIYPGYNFKLVDCLLTNFHLPRTSLFILVCAFAGRDLIMKAYQEAIDKKYRFYSYGDAMLIL
ncbi:MAG: tRNA preQ1(34) S-adenosylmethionine ribosyltransferase-isomerase QueA [Candidatus Omnitrophica bacterium]|nr:tRNA preQ1(34) S-adenosylmethionine ribosyltransferase-isomerase QueA [Candidatus Omnitrophota bacterium]